MLHRFPYIRPAIPTGTIFCSTNAKTRNSVSNSPHLWSRWPGLIIIIYNIHMHCLTTIASMSCPVIENIISHIHIFPVLSRCMRSQTWHSALMVCKQIMMKGSSRTSPYCTVTMLPLVMTCCSQTLRNQTPLNG